MSAGSASFKGLRARARKVGTFRNFGRDLSWVLFARLIAAVSEFGTIVLLAFSLAPDGFAVVASVQVAAAAWITLNGWGINQRLLLRYSQGADEHELKDMFAARMVSAWRGATIWTFASVLAWVITGSHAWISLFAVWVIAEQVTQVWNGLSIADGRPAQLATCYSARRIPPFLVTAVAIWAEWQVVWAWASGMVIGALVAFVLTRRHPPYWARRVTVNVGELRRPVRKHADMGFWFSQLGLQLQRLDVLVMSFMAPIAAGNYAAAIRFFAPINTVATASASIAFPRFARRADGVTQRVVGACLFAVAMSAVFGSSLALLLVGWPSILPGQYTELASVLVLVIVSAVIQSPVPVLTAYIQTASSSGPRAVGSFQLGVAALRVTLVGLAGLHSGAYAAGLVLCVVTIAQLIGTLGISAYCNRRPASR